VAADSFTAAVSSESWFHVSWSSSRDAVVAATSAICVGAVVAATLHSLTYITFDGKARARTSPHHEFLRPDAIALLLSAMRVVRHVSLVLA
jgi:hypothetical protein